MLYATHYLLLCADRYLPNFSSPWIVLSSEDNTLQAVCAFVYLFELCFDTLSPLPLFQGFGVLNTKLWGL